MLIRRKIEPRIALTLDGHVVGPIEADVEESATPAELSAQLEPHIAEMLMSVRDLLAEVLVGLGTRGLVLRGTLTLGGHTETLGG